MFHRPSMFTDGRLPQGACHPAFRFILSPFVHTLKSARDFSLAPARTRARRIGKLFSRGALPRAASRVESHGLPGSDSACEPP